MATTPNYGWVTPAPTDFVVDLPADFETFADAVDDTIKDLNPGTTAGDLDYYTSSTAKARLAIGTAGQLLAVNSGATAPEWITFAGSGITQIATATPSAATTVSFTSIPTTYKELLVLWDDTNQNTTGYWSVRLNNSSSNVYTFSANGYNNGTFGGGNSSTNSSFGNSTTTAPIADATHTTASRKAAGFFRVFQAGSAVKHPVQWGGTGFTTADGANGAIYGSGVFQTASAITQIDFIRSSTQTITGNFYLFGVN